MTMVERIFVIAASQSLLSSLQDTLTQAGLGLVGTAASGDQARAKLQYIDTDMILLIAPVGQETGDRLAKDLHYIKPHCGIIAAVPADKLALFDKRLADTLTFLIAKPLSKAALLQAIRHMQRTLTLFAASQQKYADLEKKLDDFRLISRAKNVLIANLHMTEPQAHSYIQKQSMDMRLSPKEIAEGILNTYEL